MAVNFNTDLALTGSVNDVGNIVQNVTNNYPLIIIIAILIALGIISKLIVNWTSSSYERKIKKDLIDHHTEIAKGHQNIIKKQHGTIDRITQDLGSKLDSFIQKK